MALWLSMNLKEIVFSWNFLLNYKIENCLAILKTYRKFVVIYENLEDTNIKTPQNLKISISHLLSSKKKKTCQKINKENPESWFLIFVCIWKTSLN